MYADLHIHTYFSDGTMSPEEVVSEAKQKGIKIIAITDHNNIDAYDRVTAACIRNNIASIRGVEIDCRFKDKILHILAYGFNVTDELKNLISKNRDELEQMSIDLIKKNVFRFSKHFSF